MENPDILILDEPMNALDHNGVEEMRAVLLQMKDQGKLILIASHYVELEEMVSHKEEACISGSSP